MCTRRGLGVVLVQSLTTGLSFGVTGVLRSGGGYGRLCFRASSRPPLFGNSSKSVEGGG